MKWHVVAVVTVLLLAKPLKAGLKEDIEEAVDELPVARAIRTIVFPGK